MSLAGYFGFLCHRDLGITRIQAFLPLPVDPRGSTPGAWPGPSARRAELGNLGNIWMDSSARGDLRAEFDRSQVANGSVCRAVEPATTGEPYPSHGLGMDPAPARWLDAFPQNGYGGVMPNATVEARQMHSARAGTRPVELPPDHGAPVSGPPAEEVGYGIPHDLQQPNGSSGARSHPSRG